MMNRRRIITLLALMALLSTSLLNAIHAGASPLQAIADFNVLLGRPTNNSIAVNVIPDESGEISFEYGMTSGSYGSETGAVVCSAGVPVEVEINGLTTDTEYFYRLRFRADSGSPWTTGAEHKFHTQRPPGGSFVFTVIADSHMSGGGGTVALYEQALANVAEDEPDFHFDLGDTFWTDGLTSSSAVNGRYEQQRLYMAGVSPSSAVFVTVGNHENEEGWNLDDSPSKAILSVNARKLYYPNPIPNEFYSGNTDVSLTAVDGDHLLENYFAWEWGDALFVFIDPYLYTRIKPFSGSAGGEDNDESVIGDR